MTFLSVLAGISLTYKPVGGARFEMRFLPQRSVGVDESGSAVVSPVISRAARTAPALAGGGGAADPPNAQGGQVEVCIVLVKGEWADNLSVGQVGCG